MPASPGEGLGLGRRCGALTPHPLDGFGEVREETSLARAQLSPVGTEAGTLRATRSPSRTWSISGAFLGHVRAQPLAGRPGLGCRTLRRGPWMPGPSWCTGRGGPAAFLLFCALCQAPPLVWAGTWNPLPLGAEH